MKPQEYAGFWIRVGAAQIDVAAGAAADSLELGMLQTIALIADALLAMVLVASVDEVWG